MSLLPPAATFSVDERYSRFDVPRNEHRYDNPALYWKNKRDLWRQEEAAAATADVFGEGGLFRGFGQHIRPARTLSSPPPPPPMPHHPEDGLSASWEHRGRRDRRREPAAAAAAGMAGVSSMFPPIYRQQLPQWQRQEAGPISPPAQYMSGLHQLHGGPTPEEIAAKRQTARQYQLTLQQQMRDKEERVKREKQERLEQERREEEEARNYNPFGRVGGGAPMRDNDGHILANRKQALQQALTSSSSAPQQAGPLARGRGRVGLRSDEVAGARRDEKDDWQRSLAAQIEEKKEKKRREQEREREDERREEQRLAVERQRLDADYQREKDTERDKARKAEQEVEDKRRRKAGEAGGGQHGGKQELTDYEREQQLKGRSPRRPQHRSQGEERTVVEVAGVRGSRPPSSSSKYRTGGGGGAGGRISRALVYEEMEREMERLRAEISSETEKMRRVKTTRDVQAIKQRIIDSRQQRRQYEDNGSVQHFMRTAGIEGWTDRSGSRDDDYHNGPGPYEDDDDSIDVLVGESSFVQLPPGFVAITPRDRSARSSRPASSSSSAAGSHRPSSQRSKRASLDAKRDSVTLPIRPASPVRPLPALQKRQPSPQPAPPQPPLPRPPRQQVAKAEALVAKAEQEEEEEYGDEEFVTEGEGEEDEGTFDVVREDDGVVSEHSKLVSDTDLRDDRLDDFVTDGDVQDDSALTSANSKKGRRKWMHRAADSNNAATTLS